ncbi:MAG TPA: pyridoxal phosphate-dependent aminotransferase [Bryobacteraceae bacterium]|nr:pyridoxal phosphate-dependent aminotransferase [Bryobacteraceae bacterium]
MNTVLSKDTQREFLERGFTRRSLGRIAAMITAGAALPFYNEPAMAQLSAVRDIPPDAVKIDANENPLGPCKEAADAIHAIVQNGGRYMYQETFRFTDILSEQESVKSNYVRPFAGSSAPLHQAVLAFTSPEKPFVTCDPGYEAGERAAEFIGAKVIRVPLLKNKAYAHDVKGMAAASDSAGLIYICNPNNPSGTLTPKEDIEWLVENKPKGSIVMIDEAYIHIAGAPMMSHLVAKDQDVIILRTFSKIYGMAGLRAGAAIARPDLLQKLSGYSSGALPITGMAAATASLKSKDLVPTRRKIMGDTRNDLHAFLDKHNFKYVPSTSNCIMIDVGKPGGEVQMALRNEKVYIGRVWKSWPTHVRVSIGTPEEMAKFKTAFLKVMA